MYVPVVVRTGILVSTHTSLYFSHSGLRSHRFTFSRIPSLTKTFGGTFFCRTISKWNTLPDHEFPNKRSFKRGFCCGQGGNGQGSDSVLVFTFHLT